MPGGGQVGTVSRAVVVGDELVRGYAPGYREEVFVTGRRSGKSSGGARRAYALEMQQLWMVLEVFADRPPLLGRVRAPREGEGVEIVSYSKDARDYSHLDGTAVAWQ